jgi:hypothetical protein
MTEISDRELQQWIKTWTAPADTPSGAPESIYRHVQKRSRLLRLALVSEVAVVIAVSPLLVRAAVVGDTLERIAMALLAMMAVAAVGFSWWNWRGAVRASGASTAAFLELSMMRVLRLRRAIVAGWCLLAAEVLVFMPWIWYRLYRNEAPPGAAVELFSWGLLTTMTLLGAGCLVALTRWARRERAQLENLRAELLGEH